MNCKNNNVNEYLRKFDEILNKMESLMLSQKIINCITIDFIRCMIPHHQVAIYMCENLLQYRIDSRLKFVTQDIIEEQRQGIEELEKVRNKYFNQILC